MSFEMNQNKAFTKKNEDSSNNETLEKIESKQEAFHRLKEANAEFHSFLNKEIDIDEAELAHIAESSMSPVEKKASITNVMAPLRKLMTENAFKRVVTSAAAYAMYFGMGTEEAKAANPSDSEILNMNSMEMSADLAHRNDSGTANFLEYEPETEPDTTENLSEKEPTEKIHVLESQAKFDLAKTDLESAHLELIDQEITTFLESFSPDELEKIKSGHIVLKFEAGSSKEPITAPIETSMGIINNNYELSEARAEIYKTKILEKLTSQGINNPITLVKIPIVEGLEPGVSEDNERFSSVTAFELTDENMAQFADTIIIDGSGSMENDKKVIEEIIEKSTSHAKMVEVKLGNLHGETLEYYFTTLYDQVRKAQQGDIIFMIGDEMADDFRNTNADAEKLIGAQTALFNEITKIIEEKNLNVISKRINIENPEESIINNFTKTGLMMTMGENDADSFKKNKEYLERND